MTDSQVAPDQTKPAKAEKADKPRPPLRWSSPRVVFSGIAIVAALFLSFLIRAILWLPFAWSYLIAMNVVTFLLYFYDKTVAKIGLLRVPEFVLHVVTVAGGTPAAFLGQNLFNHKTTKGTFRRMFWMIVVGQFIVFGAWIYLTRQ